VVSVRITGAQRKWVLELGLGVLSDDHGELVMALMKIESV
jgi:hypothetical protein